MRTTTWSHPTDPETMKRRAAGRKHYNAVRRRRASYRRNHEIFRLLDELDLNLWDRGARARIARELGVHRSTICRDFKAIKEGMHDEKACRVCGRAG